MESSHSKNWSHLFCRFQGRSSRYEADIDVSASSQLHILYHTESLVGFVKRLTSEFGIETSSVNEAQSHSTMPTFGNYEWLQTAHLSNRAHLNHPCIAYYGDLTLKIHEHVLIWKMNPRVGSSWSLICIYIFKCS